MSRFPEIEQVIVLEHNSSLHAIVQLKPQFSLDQAPILEFIKGQEKVYLDLHGYLFLDSFVNYKHLKSVQFVDELERTASGKTSRWQAQELFNSLSTKST